MMRGDLSNESPHRWMVTLDALLLDGSKVPKKKITRTWEETARNTELDILRLGKIWQAANRFGLRFELIVFGQPQAYNQALEMNMDRFGVTPIAWVSGFKDRPMLRAALPFRPDVQAIVDERSMALTWGARGIRIEDL
jgi:hypothetical protein